MNEAQLIKNALQHEMNKIDPSLTLEVDSYEQVISVRDKARNAQREWKYVWPFKVESACRSIAGYFADKRKLHPESYATCACHQEYYGR